MGSQRSPCGPHLRLSLFIHPVDLTPNEHSDLAFAPSLLAVQEIRDEEGEAWQGRSPGAKRKGLRTESLCLSTPHCHSRTLPSLDVSCSATEELARLSQCTGQAGVYLLV